MPWPVERYRVGKHSPGTRNVVAFGPAGQMSASRICKNRYSCERDNRTQGK